MCFYQSAWVGWCGTLAPRVGDSAVSSPGLGCRTVGVALVGLAEDFILESAIELYSRPALAESWRTRQLPQVPGRSL